MPSTVFRFYSGVPLDMGYQNHVYATSPSGYSGALSTYLTQTASNQSYHRIGSPIEVNLSFAVLSPCNYVAIQNPGERIYYGFVTDVTYISPANTQVTYTIDVIGTYLNQGYVSLGSSYVERCHSSTDNVGDNTVPEDDVTAETLCNSVTSSDLYENGSYIVVSAAYDLNEYHADTWGEMINGIYQGANLYKYATSEYTTLNEDLTHAADDNQLESILSIFMFPVKYYPAVNSDLPLLGSVQVPNNTTHALDGYTPVNKKLYTYPYRYLEVDNSENASLKFHYELFDNPSQIAFTLQACVTPTPVIGCNAAGYGESNRFATANSLMMESFPVCSFVVDSYRAWYAMNKNAYLGQNLSGLVGTWASAVTGNVIPAVASAGQFATSLLAQNVSFSDKEKYLSNTVKGAATSDLEYATGQKEFYFREMCWRSEMLRIKDHYFTMYGYQQNRVATPPRHNRAKCTYVKTVGCNVSGSAPADAIEEIKQIHDRGITYWSSFANFFDYTNNTPLG